MLAYVCILVKGASQLSWYMEGSGEATLARIHKVMPDSMRQWLEWPMIQISGDLDWPAYGGASGQFR